MLLAALMTSVLIAPVSAEVQDSSPSVDEQTGRYVVVMAEEPLVTQFGTDGVNSAEAASKGEQLIEDQKNALRAAGLSRDAASYNYTASLNGFAVAMTEDQAARMKTTDGVLMVLEDFMRFPQTNASTDFLGLTKPGGSHKVGNLGEGVVVGVIDSGIWPEHPSFADDGTFPDLGLELDESEFPACDFGNTAHHPDDAPFECNNKLIGARQVLPTYRALIGAEDHEFDSARDEDGHGSHTASTAAGNAGVEAHVLGESYGRISGIAPRASVIAYKALGELGGFTSDLAAAIDQAVLDGVDVINYSVGGGAGDVSADEIAFLFAADAGVHVATSAGNSGPGPMTLGDPATKPWLTSVGASTQARYFEGTVRIGNRALRGISITPSLGRTMLVDSVDAGSELCIPGELDPEVVEGKIVLCRRGQIARLGKSFAVYQAGGAGMVLYNNNDTDDLISDSHFVPSVHVRLTEGLFIKDYIASNPAPYGRLTGGDERRTSAPVMASFSSRGSNPVASDIIKPDVTAPGVQILAATTPVPIPGSLPPGELFMAIAGTSMSSPHVAGLMALIDEKHPDWSAAAVKSAIMTTAHQRVTDSDGGPADPFDMGAGHIDPDRPSRKGSPFQPGLVYEAGFLDYLGYMCDDFPEELNPTTCPFLESIGIPTEATGLNYPSIGVSELAGSQTITRTVTDVTVEKPFKTYIPIIEAPEGYEVTVTPEKLRIRSGQSATYQVTITNVSAPVGEWRHGSLTWKSNRYEVRSPISVKGVDFAAPGEVMGEGVDGSTGFDILFGYEGDYSAAAHGLEPAMVFSDNVLQDPDQTFDPTTDVEAGGANLHEVTTSGAALLRIAMPPEAAEANSDMDIFVIGPAGNQIGASTAGGTNELLNFVLPADGTYQIYVHGWSAPGGDTDYDLFVWVVSATPGGNMIVDSAPASAVLGSTDSIGVSWTGAAAGEWHLGAVSHTGPDGLMGLTVVEVDNRGVEGGAEEG
ncbi:MAG: S8 family serine peptidase [Actinomycetota bacterium]